MIHLKNISKTYDNGQTFSVNNVTLSVPEGKTLVLLGSSGCGKTTLLKMINRLIEPSEGKIWIDDKEIHDYNLVTLRRTIGYAFQKIGLFPHLSVGTNITIALKLMGMDKKKQRTRAYELLEMVNLSPKTFYERFPNELSGGQQQRVGVARALATHPSYLLMDEPFGALDPVSRDAIQEEFISLQRRLSITVIFVSHDIFEAIRIGDLIAVMKEGKIEQLGSPADLINNPHTPFVEALFQQPLSQLTRYQDELL